VDIEFTAQLLQLAGASRGGPLRQGTLAALEAAGADGLSERHARALADAWRLQTGLAQLLAAALEEGLHPRAEPEAFKRKLASAGGVRTFAALEAKLKRAQARRARLPFCRQSDGAAR
jgi:glutamate-ammonia-ligase adenylyltransferase